MPASDTQLHLLIDRVLLGEEAARSAPLPRLRPAVATDEEDVSRPQELAAVGTDRRRVSKLDGPTAPGIGRSSGRIGSALL